MHVLYVHPNFPAQFGHLAAALARRPGFRCTYVSELPPATVAGVERIQYRAKGGATQYTHYTSRTFENAVWNTHAVYEALAARPDVRPDLVVGHAGFGTTLFLRELYPCPVLNYFEFFYHPRGSDLDFRPDARPTPDMRMRSRVRNAMVLLDLNNCDAGYAPTRWQKGLFPEEYGAKIRVLFDGIDTAVWRRHPALPRRIAGRELGPNTRLVTYVARGLESMRGFDVFMKVAKRVAERRPDVLFVVVGKDRSYYGGDELPAGVKSYKEWVLSRDGYDPSRFLFVDWAPPDDLARLFSLTDLHVYLTVPFVLSWSLWDALACGATVLASDTAPVRELVRDGENGLLADFFDVEGLADRAVRVLDSPAEFAPLGRAAAELVRNQYSLDVLLPRHVRLYEEVANRPPPPAPGQAARGGGG